MRIVSLLPSATEIVFALGLGDHLVGRTAACDSPEEVAGIPIVTLPPGSQPARFRTTALPGPGGEAAGSAWPQPSPIHVDADLVRALHPDLVLAGGLPQGGSVGEADSSTIERLVGRGVSVVRLQPRSVEGILNSIATVGAFCEAEDEAIGLIEILRERLGTIENRILERRLEGVPSRRAVVLGWLDPPVAVGRWVPEMVRRAGGWELLGTEGETATTVAWERLRDVEPELVVLAFEGHDAAQAARRLGTARLPRWFDGLEAVRDGELFAVDGGLYWRPGPRVIDGIALLAELLDPEAFAGAGPTEAWIPLGPVGIGVGPAPA